MKKPERYTFPAVFSYKEGEEISVFFPDLDVAHWAYYDIMESTNSHGYQISDGIECWTELY